MPRRRLTASEKAVMQAARVRTREQREAAAAALADNPQFGNPKFWLSVPAEAVQAVSLAMDKARKLAKKGRIAALEAELRQLKGE